MHDATSLRPEDVCEQLMLTWTGFCAHSTLSPTAHYYVNGWLPIAITCNQWVTHMLEVQKQTSLEIIWSQQSIKKEGPQIIMVPCQSPLGWSGVLLSIYSACLLLPLPFTLAIGERPLLWHGVSLCPGVSDPAQSASKGIDSLSTGSRSLSSLCREPLTYFHIRFVLSWNWSHAYHCSDSKQ